MDLVEVKQEVEDTKYQSIDLELAKMNKNTNTISLDDDTCTISNTEIFQRLLLQDSQQKQFQAEEVMLILKAYVENLEVFKNPQAASNNGESKKKALIRQITQECNSRGHGTRTEKQIEQKLRDELKKLRKFKNEMCEEQKKTMGNLLVYPRASQGTLYLYNEIYLKRSQSPTSRKVYECFETALNGCDQSINNDFTDSLTFSIAKCLDNDYRNSMLYMGETSSFPKVKKEINDEDVSSSSRSTSNDCDRFRQSSVLDLPNRKRKRTCSRDLDSENGRALSRNEKYRNLEDLEKELKEQQIRTELTKQEYYRVLCRNEDIRTDLLKAKIEDERARNFPSSLRELIKFDPNH